MSRQQIPIKGRGAADNPPNRFAPLHLERDLDWNPEEDPSPATQFFRDHTQTIIAYNESPDVGFDASVNPYRGCEHGCIYCYARPTHEYLGFSAGLDFETKIMVKQDAPDLLRRELASPRWKPQVIAMSGVTDCYQPIERKLKLTRRCLEVLAAFRNPVCVVTKNHLVTRDIDLLLELAHHAAAAVYVSVTTLDGSLTPKLEPRTSLPQHRLAAVAALSQAEIPVGVLIAPVIPALTDHELPSILAAAAQAGARFAGYVLLRLPHAVGPLFERWLEQHYPQRKEKVVNRIRAMRGGQMNDLRFGKRMRGEGIFAEQMSQMFHAACRKAGLAGKGPELSAAAFRKPPGAQMELGLAG
ncbi:MAG: PA0069 family radical SAM protein [Chloroflexi bacterium]|nr:PA0069 family radical SAM protein [Chloroflexota bacterium]